MDIKALKEEFSTIHTEANGVLTLAGTEKRELTGEETEANKKRFARMDAIQAQITDAKRLAAFSVTNGDAELPAVPPGKAEFEQERTGKVEFDKDTYKAAVNHFARLGDISKLQKFTIISTTASGAYLPKEVLPPVNVRRLPNAIRQALAIRGVTPISRALTESISIPIQDDSANLGQAQSQSATSGTAVDPSTSGSVTLNPTLYSSKQQWLSNTTVNAVDFDLFSYMLPMLVKRLDKAEESAWVTTLMNNATVGNTSVSPSGFTYAEWMVYEHSLAAAYRTDGVHLMSDSAYQKLRSLVDNNNRPIMDLDPTNEFMATVHGKPIVVSDYFGTVAASNVVAAFASAEALLVFDAGIQRVARYTLQPAYPDQTGFELFANADFNFVPGGVRTLAMHS